MKFNDWRMMCDVPRVKNARHLAELVAAYENVLDASGMSSRKQVEEMFYFMCEASWKCDNRPYYAVYPAVAEALSRTKLKMPYGTLSVPHGLRSLLVRFPIGHEYRGRVRSLLFTIQKDVKILNDVPLHHMLLVLAQMVDDTAEMATTFYLPQAIIEDTINHSAKHRLDLDVAERSNAQLYTQEMVRIVTGICLLEQDPELIIPDVLDRDKDRLQDAAITPEAVQHLIDRAHRRGKVGWVVGECTDESATTEKAAHYRSAHWGFRWAGPHKSRLKWTKIKGCVVRRDKLTTIPTGYLDDESKVQETTQ